jgi:2-polyprenyl-6-methoxyphenol hydroxylase-like FAD-dependent oxidoreductase
MPASLVVDSSGRSSTVTTWLAETGHAPIREEVVTCDVGYSSCFYHRPPDDATPSVLIQPRPPDHPVLGVLIAVEGNRWQLLLGGMAGHYPPTDPDGMLALTRDLASPDIYDVLRQTQPCARPRGFRVPSTRLRRFDRSSTWPAGLVVLGDAVAAFNPIYAQGMTVAARQALALRDLAGAQSPGWEAAFQREAGRIAALPWAIGVGEDLRWSGVTLDGHPASRRQRLQNWYLDRVYAAATVDPVISQATIETINLLHDSPPFLRPTMMARVLRTRGTGLLDPGRNRPAPRVVLGRGASS